MLCLAMRTVSGSLHLTRDNGHWAMIEMDIVWQIQLELAKVGHSQDARVHHS